MNSDANPTLPFRAYLLFVATFTLPMLTVPSQTHADTVYDVSINTASLNGVGSTLAFDFVSGGGTQSNQVTISNFATNGTLLGSPSLSGSVSGALPGTVTLTNGSFFNEALQGITLGSTLSFQLDSTANAPGAGSIPDTFSFFVLDPTGTNSLLTTSDPTGANSLFTLQIDGSQAGQLGIYSASPAIPLTATPSTVPLPSSFGLLLFGVLGLGSLATVKRDHRTV